MFSGKAEPVKLRFENRFVNAMIDRFGYETKIHIEDDEHFSVVVNIKTEHPEPFFAWVFKFGGAVEIVEPVELRERYAEMIKSML